jgi:uncharacterized membrane protein
VAWEDNVRKTTPRKKPKSDSASPEKKNVRTIADLEHSALHHRSLTARIGDAVSRIAGSGLFIVAHLAWFSTWIVLNSGKVGGFVPFDPFPFTFLTFVVSLEAIFLAIFVLVSQNRMAHQADRRAHLDLQINLLAEEESTMILRMLRELCLKQRIDPDKLGNDGKALLHRTDLQALMKDLEKHLPEEM